MLHDKPSNPGLGQRRRRIATSAFASGLLLLLLQLALSVRHHAHSFHNVVARSSAGDAERLHVPGPRRSDASSAVLSDLASKHIVVAHCKENLAWLNQLADYDPAICRRVHIHVYSKCGMSVDLKTTLPAVAECATLHRLMNFGTQEYAYFRYIEDLYDNLPPLVSFVQAGGLTENPHLIYDLAGHDPPGLTYRSLARHIRVSWHFIDYETVEKKGEAEIVSRYFGYLKNQSEWLSDWRSMFTASRAQIRRNPWAAYAFINDKLAHGECKSVHCVMENLFSSFFGCNPLFFDEGGPGCTRGVYTGLAYVLNEEDFRADGLHQVDLDPANDTEWQICGSRTILYSISTVNGVLLCLDDDDDHGDDEEHQATRAAATVASAEANRRLLQAMIEGDTWRADLSDQTFGQAPEWFRHEENLDAMKQ